MDSNPAQGNLSDTPAEVNEGTAALKRQLQLAEERIRRLLASLPVGLIVATQSGKVESVNPRLQDMFGCMGAEFASRPLTHFLPVPEDDTTGNGQNILLLVDSGTSMEIDARRWDGRFFPVEVTVNSLSSPDGERLLISVYDITERRELERMKQEVFSMITHDLRTPLATIGNFFEMLDAGLLGEMNENGERMLGLAERNAKRMLGLINDLLDVQRAKSNMLSLEVDACSLEEILRQASEPLTAWANEHEVRIEVEATDLIIMADSDRLVRVVTNLLSNAVKFSPAGTAIRLKAERDATFARINVTDQGRGIPPEKLGSLFEQFTQVDNRDATVEGGGSGLGLAICKSFVELHGGTISVTSEVNKGTTFSFTIPLSTSS